MIRVDRQAARCRRALSRPRQWQFIPNDCDLFIRGERRGLRSARLLRGRGWWLGCLSAPLPSAQPRPETTVCAELPPACPAAREHTELTGLAAAESVAADRYESLRDFSLRSSNTGAGRQAPVSCHTLTLNLFLLHAHRTRLTHDSACRPSQLLSKASVHTGNQFGIDLRCIRESIRAVTSSRSRPRRPRTLTALTRSAPPASPSRICQLPRVQAASPPPSQPAALNCSLHTTPPCLAETHHHAIASTPRSPHQ